MDHVIGSSNEYHLSTVCQNEAHGADSTEATRRALGKGPQIRSSSAIPSVVKPLWQAR